MSTGAIPLMSRLRTGALRSLAMRVLGSAALFLMHIALSRSLGAAAYGEFSYALMVAGILVIFAPLGWPTALMRLLVQYSQQGEWSLLRGALRRSWQWVLGASLVVSALLWGVSGLLRADLESSFRYAGLVLPILCLVTLRRKALVALKQVVASSFPDEVLLPLIMVLGVWLMSIRTTGSAVALYASASLVALGVGGVLLGRALPDSLRTVERRFRTRTWLMLGLPMLLAAMSQVVLNRTDVVMLGAIRPMAEVGVYSAANRLAVLNTFVLGAINTIAAPMLGDAFYSGRHADFRSVLKRATIWSVLGAAPSFAIILLFPRFLMQLFGAEFTGYGNLLRILGLGQFLNAMTGPVGFALMMSGRERTFAGLTAAAAAANVVANFVLIPRYHTVGAAIATAGSVACLNLGMFYVVRFTSPLANRKSS